MYVYVVTYTDDNQSHSFLNGIYGVFSTKEKAQYAVFDYIIKWKDTLLDTNNSESTTMLFITAQGRWEIEQIKLNDTSM